MKAKRLSDIGTLTATAAHDLRDRLGAIIMAASNIKRKAKNPHLDPHLLTIDKKVRESNEIISGLLSQVLLPKKKRVAAPRAHDQAPA